MICIYKITSPTGRIYIGQSKVFELRIKNYKKLRCKTQPKLFKSFLKHGIERHKFEVLEECVIADLTEKEQFYIRKFDACSTFNLNCKGDYFVTYFSEETISKMRQSHLGQTSYMAGKNHSESTRLKMSHSKMGNTNKKGTKVSKEGCENFTEITYSGLA